jgi:hypothetical protein
LTDQTTPHAPAVEGGALRAAAQRVADASRLVWRFLTAAARLRRRPRRARRAGPAAEPTRTEEEHRP